MCRGSSLSPGAGLAPPLTHVSEFAEYPTRDTGRDGLTKLIALGLAALVFSSTARADTIEQAFENEWDATFYSGSNAYSSWQYQAYEPFDSSLGELESVEVSVSITLSGQAGDTFRFRNSFFTGWSPAAYQHYDDDTIVDISANEQIDRTYSYTTPAGVAPWIDPDYATVGAFQYFESRSYDAAHSVFVTTTITFVYDVPVILDDVADYIAGLDSGDFSNANRQGTLGNKLDAISNLITAGDLCDAIDKLQDEILPKMDGDPSPPDWVTGATTQAELVQMVQDLIDSLQIEADALGGC